MNKIANRVAQRFKVAHWSVKLPVTYALAVNCKKLLSSHEIEVDDEMLQEILSRYLDLVIFGLCNDSAPSKDDLLNIANEVLDEYNDSDDFEDEYIDDEEEDRF